MKSTLKIIIAFFFAALESYSQTKTDYTKVDESLNYKLIGTYDISRLNNILTKEIPEQVGTKVTYTPAKNAVKLYRVEYWSVIPEQNNKPTKASGLIAIPVTGLKSMPMISYQHGTVFGKRQVPSFPEESFETRLMIAQFAAQGYIVIGADYFGLGISEEKEGYLVVKSHQQACYDMYEIAKKILEKEQVQPTDLFLTGWSQGGLVTMAFLEKLENSGVKVKAAGTACGPSDGYIMLNTALFFPRKIDAPWLSVGLAMMACAYEEYYKVPGLVSSFINPEYLDVVKRIYLKDTTLKPQDFTYDLHKLIRPECFNPNYLKSSAFGKLASDLNTYKWIIQTPVHMYYGEIDEAVNIGLAKLPSEYQKALGNNLVESFSTGPDANHRIGYARAVPEWKIWFDDLSSKK